MGETVLILARHGATQANVCRPHVLQGLRPDSELVAAGVAQARAAARALRGYPLAQAYCSPLKRARQTARLIARPRGLPLAVEEALAEAGVGLWAGLSWDEIAARWPDEDRAFHADPERHGYLGGENLASENPPRARRSSWA